MHQHNIQTQNIQTQKGSITLSSEAIILTVFVICAFAALAYMFSSAEKRMEETSSWVECANILDCPNIETTNTSTTTNSESTSTANTDF